MKRKLFTRTMLISVLFSALLSFTACKSDEDKCIEGDQTACQQVLAKGTWVDKRDGKMYKMVKIGSQTWMAENLNYESDSSFCYNNEDGNCAKYGRLYRWAAAIGKSESECGAGNKCSLPSGNIQGVCPSGWHLPSITEWESLINSVGGESMAGKALKSSSGWNSSGNGADAFGFSVLPAGLRDSIGNYGLEGLNANYWSSTENDDDSNYAYCMLLGNASDLVFLANFNKFGGFSVRCLKD